MKVRTFRARSLPDALHLVRDELGPAAQVLSTESKPSSLWARLTGRRFVEVTALADEPASQVAAPEASAPLPAPAVPVPAVSLSSADGSISEDYRSRFKQYASEQTSESLLESLVRKHEPQRSPGLTSTLFQLFTDLMDADVDERFARELIEEIQQHSTPAELSDFGAVKAKAVSRLEGRIHTAPTIGAYANERRVVALVGPTGVGKTTTIAKLAANLRLRDKRRVGLITVDTYRIAAVDQLRAYADIIDLPMRVVTTPREMRDAVATLAELDIVLIDTAGRSPHDEIQIQELKAMLTEAQANEIQLVLSSVASARHLTRLVEHFAAVRPTSLVFTKLDEAVSYGHLLPLMCDRNLPISYTTHGQNVPDDIQPADPPRLIESMLAN